MLRELAIVSSGGVRRKSYLLLLLAKDDFELELTLTDAISLTMIENFDGLSANNNLVRSVGQFIY